MKKHDVKKVREAVGALDELDVPAPEILRRLQEDECGIGYPVDISRRAVYYHRTAFRQEKARAETKTDQLNGSLASSKQRAVDLLNRELEAYERRRPGTMAFSEAGTVERIYKALANIEKTENQRGRRPSANGSSPSEKQPETALEQLARQEKTESAPEPKPEGASESGADQSLSIA